MFDTYFVEMEFRSCEADRGSIDLKRMWIRVEVVPVVVEVDILWPAPFTNALAIGEIERRQLIVNSNLTQICKLKFRFNTKNDHYRKCSKMES